MAIQFDQVSKTVEGVTPSTGVNAGEVEVLAGGLVTITTNKVSSALAGQPLNLAVDGKWELPTATGFAGAELGDVAFAVDGVIDAKGVPVGYYAQAVEEGTATAVIQVKPFNGAVVAVNVSGATAVGTPTLIDSKIPAVTVEAATEAGTIDAWVGDVAAVSVSGITASAGGAVGYSDGAIVAAGSGVTIIGYYLKDVASTDTTAVIKLAPIAVANA